MFGQRRQLAEIVTTWAGYQLAATTAASRTMAALSDESPKVNPRAYAGVSSAGFPLFEPLVATIDRFAPAPAESLPANWWDEEIAKFLPIVEQLIESEVQDAGRSAFQAEMVAAPDWQNYVRVLVPPSCKRCVPLAGRIYRDLDGFERHPQCDCQHWPVQNWEEAHDAGLVFSPQEAFDKGYIRDLTEAETKAITDGADINRVINSSAGVYTADLFGRRVKATRQSTTRRSAWRKANPTRLVRLRPEAIYKFAKDREDAIRLLRIYGYIT
jgi:hypothetical protein